MDKIIESFKEFIDGAVEVKLWREFKTIDAGITAIKIVVLKPGDEYDDDALPTHPYWETRRVGFARRKAANEVLGNMHKALFEMGFEQDEAKYSFSKWSHENDW